MTRTARKPRPATTLAALAAHVTCVCSITCVRCGKTEEARDRPERFAVLLWGEWVVGTWRGKPGAFCPECKR